MIPAPQDPSKTQKITGTEQDSLLSGDVVAEENINRGIVPQPESEPEIRNRPNHFWGFTWPRPLMLMAGTLIIVIPMSGWLFKVNNSILESLDRVAENEEVYSRTLFTQQQIHQGTIKKYQQEQDLSEQYRTVNQKKEQEILGLRQSLALLASNALAQEKLQKLSAQNEAASTKMDQVMADSKETLAKTKKQMEILEDANQKLQEEVDRLKLMQAETQQKTPPTDAVDRQAFRMNWTEWVEAENAGSFLRESVIKKSRLPLAVEGKLSKSGSMFRFFVIPNLYQIRWQVEWGLTDDALIKKIGYLGGKKYYELNRQTFMLNNSAPMHQVVFIHHLDMDEAKRLKGKYFVAEGK